MEKIINVMQRGAPGSPCGNPALEMRGSGLTPPSQTTHLFMVIHCLNRSWCHFLQLAGSIFSKIWATSCMFTVSNACLKSRDPPYPLAWIWWAILVAMISGPKEPGIPPATSGGKRPYVQPSQQDDHPLHHTLRMHIGRYWDGPSTLSGFFSHRN